MICTTKSVELTLSSPGAFLSQLDLIGKEQFVGEDNTIILGQHHHYRSGSGAVIQQQWRPFFGYNRIESQLHFSGPWWLQCVFGVQHVREEGLFRLRRRFD